MKTRIATYLTIISMVLFIIPLSSLAQKAHTSIDEEYEWTAESKTETLYVDVKKNSTSLVMSFAGAIEKGTLEVKVYNPDGDKIPGFILLSEEYDDGKVSVNISTGENQKGTQTTTTTSTSTGKSTSITTTSGSGVGASSNVTVGKSSEGSSYAVSSSSSNSKGAKGVMNRILSDPEPGKWKLVISVKDVTGKLDVAIVQK